MQKMVNERLAALLDEIGIETKKKIYWEESIESIQIVKTHPNKTDKKIEDVRVLLVEDQPSNRKTLEVYLKHKVGKVDIAENGKQAVEKYAKEEYDIILMDLQMPIMGGIEASLRIRKIEEERQVKRPTPIIAFTANYYSDDKDISVEIGMDVYLSKPFQCKTIYELIQEYV
ncbi:response regulator [Marinifilum sp. JC070]|uniref:Response regulator n=2 Tax=Marinifilum caeruleilacunae TaxID=2499076 RepID=A0ABX1WWN2_9BACT|nr:response regulator [Marinifilum caeruleilacunae]